jgi:O-antigen/teichoic acid export membrane protein
MVISALFEVFLSFIYFRPLPKLLWERIKAVQILQRSKWITMAGIFNYLYQFGDNLVVGRMLGTSSLGLYDYAYKISGTPVSEISDVVARVSFPVYVQINKDPERLKKAFIKTVFTVSSVSSLIGLIIFIFARPLVLIILGAEWATAIPVLRVLSLCGVAKSITGSVYPLMLASKRNNYITWITLVGVLGMGVSIVPLITLWGIVGAGIAAIIGSFSSLPLSLYYVNKIFKSKKQPK